MAYRIEGKDIVLSGFETGVAESPYKGIADMRNVEISSYPTEASVQFAQTQAAKPPVLNAVAYTADAATDSITIPSTAGLYNGCAVVLAANTATGLTNGIVYYVYNVVGSTLQLTTAPFSPTPVNITANGTGTLTTYQYGNQRGTSSLAPISYWVDRSGQINGINSTLIMDGSNYLWLMLSGAVTNLPADSLIFLGNIGGVGASAIIQSGVAIWNGYILIFGASSVGVDYARASNILVNGPASTWVYGWQFRDTQARQQRVPILSSQEDGNLYFATGTGLGSVIEQPGTTFDPANASTYAITDTAVIVPEADEVTCLDELGSNILIGGRRSFVYVWDKISPNFNALLNVPDTFISNIVATNQNAYIFAGNRGRIYITNGSGIELYKNVPDYLTGLVNPYIRWEDASFMRNQLIFSFRATTNTGTVSPTVNGVWAIDLNTDAFRMLVKTSNTGYAGLTRMVAEKPELLTGLNNGTPGAGVVVGWHDGTAHNVDMGTGNPYQNYEAYIDTELLPVGTFLDAWSPSQVEWKTAAPLVAGEGVRISYRTNISEPFTLIGESTTAGRVSDMFKTNFQKAQWVQLRVEMRSTATNPSFVRLTEVRLRDWPAGSYDKQVYGK